MSSRLRLLPFALAPAVVALAAAIGPWGISRARSAPPPTGTWQLDAPSTPHAIEGFASASSVAPGDALRLHVSATPAARYRIEIYRIGWYAGTGGRLIACLPACDGDEQGSSQALSSPDPTTGELDARWPITDRITIGTDWASGLYLAKFVLTSGAEAGTSTGTPFVVKAPPGNASALLVVMPVNTWQAYNEWGGKSLYTDPDAAVKVSFDRPYAPEDDQIQLAYPVARFIDQFAYDASYVTDADVDADPGQLVDHRLVVVPSHSEYWTKAMRDGFEAARGLGTNLAFLGGNTGYWQIRYADADRRVLEEYRSASLDPSANPRQKTVRWRDTPVQRPECTLVGIQWQGGDDSTDPGPHDYRVAARNLGDAWFQGTGFKEGDAVKGAVGREWDSVAPECAGKTPPLTVFFHYQGKATPEPPGIYTSTFHSTNADVVRYQEPSGATVLAVGSMEFGWSITGSADGSTVAAGVTSPTQPPDPRLQRFLRNAIAAMTQPRSG